MTTRGPWSSCLGARLHGDAVFVERQDLADGEGGQAGQQDGERGAVARERLVRHQRLGHLRRVRRGC